MLSGTEYVLKNDQQRQKCILMNHSLLFKCSEFWRQQLIYKAAQCCEGVALGYINNDVYHVTNGHAVGS